MISKQEIMDFAREFNLPVTTIEKDYVLGWLLAGIQNDNELFEKWIFKGGTCLKKCYFETYRFSEDLDYTLTDNNHIDEKFLTDRFKNISKWIYEVMGIEIIEDTIRFEIYQNNDGKTTVEGRLNYIGSLQRRNNSYRIKLDLTAAEILVLPPVLQNVHHPYSDRLSHKIKAFCYNFSEVFAEKIRALSERARPRDLYDVIHLYNHTSGEKPAIIFDVLKKKCKYKAIPLPTMELMTKHPKLHELESEWSNMLSHQVPMLPPREQFWQELPHLFAWLYELNSKSVN
jgi:predicted nucleotidyltransferase component of viral defense system